MDVIFRFSTSDDVGYFLDWVDHSIEHEDYTQVGEDGRGVQLTSISQQDLIIVLLLAERLKGRLVSLTF